MIAQESYGSRAAAGVRIGQGSVYDWCLEEIFASGPEGRVDMEGDVEGEAALADAMQMLAAVRNRRVFTREVERAFDDVERDLRQGRLVAGGATRSKRRKRVTS